jgi:uncharacterized membrane protein YqiK
VRPGHRGIWEEPLRTGKYPINPHCYQAEIVPTCILNLNWAEAVSEAHNLDQYLKAIVAKSREGFVFSIDLQVQIHVADTEAPKVISIVGSMRNLVNEVLQAAVGNHFRDKIQSMPAIRFIETRQQVQEEAYAHIESKLKDYRIETKGVYIHLRHAAAGPGGKNPDREGQGNGGYAGRTGQVPGRGGHQDQQRHGP